MATHAPTQQRREHRPNGLLDRRYLGITGRYWIIAGLIFGLCIGIYEASHPVSPNAFDQPGAQIPNQLRSPWGVKHPL